MDGLVYGYGVCFYPFFCLHMLHVAFTRPKSFPQNRHLYIFPLSSLLSFPPRAQTVCGSSNFFYSRFHDNEGRFSFA
jgi:hypothetical protein